MEENDKIEENDKLEENYDICDCVKIGSKYGLFGGSLVYAGLKSVLISYMENDMEVKCKMISNVLPKEICQLVISYSRDPEEYFCYDQKKLTLTPHVCGKSHGHHGCSTPNYDSEIISVAFDSKEHEQKQKSCYKKIFQTHKLNPDFYCCKDNRLVEYSSNKSLMVYASSIGIMDHFCIPQNLS